MKAAVIHAYDAPPRYEDFPDPVPQADEILIRVVAAGLHPLVKSQAAGTHYSCDGVLPVVAGVDGVGRRPDGRLVYFSLPRKPYGSMAEWAVVSPPQCLELPAGVDPLVAAAGANPGMSSWAALTARIKMQRGQNVLVLGATGVAGQLAIQAARQLGARRVVGAGRNLEALAQVGADHTIALEQPDDALVEEFRRELSGGAVVLDYLWGRPAELLIAAAKRSGLDHQAPRIQLVQVGSSAGRVVNLPAEALRSSGLEIIGSGFGSLPLAQITVAIRELLTHFGPGGFRVGHETAPLRQVEESWNAFREHNRLVFVTE